MLLGNVEMLLGSIQSRLDAVDRFVDGHFKPAFAYLADTEEGGDGSKTQMHWLDVLAAKSHGYNETFTPDVVQRLEKMLGVLQKEVWGGLTRAGPGGWCAFVEGKVGGGG